MDVPHQFLDSWSYYMYLGAIAFIVLGLLILGYHEFRILIIKDLKEKYDYVNLNEIKFFWYAIIAFIVAGFMFFNTLATDMIHKSGMTWFYVRLFITTSFAIIFYFIFFSAVRIYYPRFVEKRLRKLRNKPRKSPEGNLMRKLTEQEEDAHLEESMIEEELFHSIDYDVWIDEKTGYKKIEKYFAYQHSEECPECGYYTLRIDREELEKAPTMEETGLFIKHFQCSYCNHREGREQILAKLSTNV
ncbi:MAG: hypothetical protein KF725_11550 [Cyclobacteriaceae bacterium]|nr:hypothetical protein [Cyclobacteriaceae bacterium]UYN86335.1 MAG: hypothetical protein KIT51_15945 [Cyclobacteriaceae bacterium]